MDQGLEELPVGQTQRIVSQIPLGEWKAICVTSLKEEKNNKTENNLEAQACCPVSGLCGFERGEVETGFLR